MAGVVTEPAFARDTQVYVSNLITEVLNQAAQHCRKGSAPGSNFAQSPGRK